MLVASVSQLFPGLNDITFSCFNLSLFIYNFVVVLGLHCCESFSPIVTSGDYSLAVVHDHLIAVASLVLEHRL